MFHSPICKPLQALEREKRCRSEREEDGRGASLGTAALRLISPTIYVPSLLSFHIYTFGGVVVPPR
ncbi:hypothetical protein YC2023_000717 [Brassica napus]